MVFEETLGSLFSLCTSNPCHFVCVLSRFIGSSFRIWRVSPLPTSSAGFLLPLTSSKVSKRTPKRVAYGTTRKRQALALLGTEGIIDLVERSLTAFQRACRSVSMGNKIPEIPLTLIFVPEFFFVTVG